MAYVDDLVKAHIEIKRNWQKMKIKEGEKIPSGVKIHCPMVGQDLISAEKCLQCSQFHGIGVMLESSDPKQQAELENKLPWSKRHCICCITIMELIAVGG